MKSLNILIKNIGLLLILFTMFSCDSGVHQEVREIENMELLADKPINFEFEITEDGIYDLYYVIRNDLDYPFYNLYFKNKFSNDSEIIEEGLQEVDLFDSVNGKPFGKGLGDIFEHEFSAFKNQNLKAGTYNLSLKQYMREDKVSGVISLGIIVRKAK